jgi:hypothetical protein
MTARTGYFDLMPSEAPESEPARGERSIRHSEPADGETLVERYRRRVENHRLGAVLIITVSTVVAVGAVIGVAQQVVGLFAGDDAVTSAPPTAFTSPASSSGSPPAVVHLRASELGTAQNLRYGFSFQYPLTWERQDPVNGDGLLAMGSEPGLEVRAYGALPTSGGGADQVGGGGPRVDEYVKYLMQGGGTVVDGPTQQNVRVVLSRKSSTELAASRLVTRERGGDGVPPVTTVVLLATPEGRDVTMECQAPTEIYASWAGACNQMIASLTILSDWLH